MAYIPLSAYERVSLDPLEKWKKHRRAPVKVIVHLLLAILGTYQVCYLNQESSRYVDRTQDTLVSMFILPNLELANRGPGGGDVFIYTYDDFAASLKYKVHNYFGISKFVGEFETLGPPIMIVTYRPYSVPLGHPSVEDFPIHFPPYYGPFQIFNNSQMREAVSKIQSAELVMRLHNFQHLKDRGESSVCWTWAIRAQYDFTNHARFTLRFKMSWEMPPFDNSTCGRMNSHSLVDMRVNSYIFWAGLAIIGLATVSLLLASRHFWR